MKLRTDWIGQEDSLGCLGATLAMVLGISYQEAVQKFGGIPPRDGHTYYCDQWDQILIDEGWSIARKWKYTQPGNRERAIWPPEPWADLHECEVDTGMMSHSVLMLGNGTIIDPLTREPKKLSDYVRVLSIAALFKLPTQ